MFEYDRPLGELRESGEEVGELRVFHWVGFWGEAGLGSIVERTSASNPSLHFGHIPWETLQSCSLAHSSPSLFVSHQAQTTTVRVMVEMEITLEGRPNMPTRYHHLPHRHITG